jgi:hypothetical protein
MKLSNLELSQAEQGELLLSTEQENQAHLAQQQGTLGSCQNISSQVLNQLQQ